MVAVHDVVGAHVLQVHTLLLEELQGLVHVLKAVDAHLPLCGLWLRDSSTPVVAVAWTAPVISTHPPASWLYSQLSRLALTLSNLIPPAMFRGSLP